MKIERVKVLNLKKISNIILKDMYKCIEKKKVEVGILKFIYIYIYVLYSRYIMERGRED